MLLVFCKFDVEQTVVTYTEYCFLMTRFASCFRYVLILTMLTPVVSLGQRATDLKLKPDRLKNAKQTEQEAIRKGDSLLLAEAWYLYGKTYAFAGDYRSSQSYFLKSLHILEPRGDSFEVSRLYVRLSENEGKQGHVNEALNYAKRALRVSERIQSKQGLMRAYGALGQAYEYLWHTELPHSKVKYDSIFFFYRQIETLGLTVKDTVAVAEGLTRLGTFLVENEDPKSVTYLKKALYLFTLTNKDIGRLSTNIHLASAYIILRQFELAWATLRQAEKLYESKKLNEYDLHVLLHNQFIRYFEATGQWAKAYDRLRKLNKLEKGQLLSDYGGTVTRLNIEYETEKKEALLRTQQSELALRTQNLQTQQRFTIATSALLVLTAGVSLVFFRLSRKNQRIGRRNETLLKELNHRVKNNLQVVSSLLSLQAKRLTDEAAKKAVEESRFRVESMAILHRRLYDGDQLAEADLNEFIPELANGVLKTFGYPFVPIQFSIDTLTVSADKAVPLGLILNELITNACKYAFPENRDPVLRISCHRKGNKAHLKSPTTGLGYPMIKSRFYRQTIC